MFKVKEKPEDFVVYEVADIYPEGKGEYSLYLLKKRNISTWDAIGRIAKRIRIPMDSIGFGGLKDKRAVSHQFVTIKNGPKKDIKTEEYELIYLGQTTKPMSKDLLLGNKFEVVIRDFKVEEEAFNREVQQVKNFGIPNYFDEQRFGSVKTSKSFAVKEIIKGNYEKALYLMLAEGSPVDIEKTRKLRECLKKNWRHFETCLKLAKVKWERDLLEFLSTHSPSKRTFKRALNLVDKEYLFFLGNAYQAFLWNEVLKEVLTSLELKIFKVPYLLGELYFYKELPEETFSRLKNLKLPLPSPKLSLSEEIKQVYEKVLKKEGIGELKNFRSFVKGLVFKTYPRPAITFPADLTWEKLSESSIKLCFFLEKGSYATLVVKRLCYGYKDS